MKRLTYFTLFIIIGILCVPSYSAETLAYTYDTGGSDWTDTCATGESQSPIDISNITGTCDNSVSIIALNNLVLSTNSKHLTSFSFLTYFFDKYSFIR